ncbi:MAG: P-loop NTPase [Pirellulales bacterium]|nr:P-loop NTPase [Pirellulales bacterium]
MADDISRLPSDQSDPRSMALLPNGGDERTNAGFNGAMSGEPLKKGPDPVVYLHALRRRWLMIFGIGVLIAAIAGPAVWLGMGKQYTATGFLHVAMTETPVAFKAEGTWTDVSRYEIYKNTQLQYILNRFVLMGALRKTEVASIPVIQKERLTGDVVEWLSKSLHVGFPGRSEVMSVSLSLPDPGHAQTIVQSVIDSFMAEAVNNERDEKRERYDELERVCADKEREIRKKREVLRGLGMRFNTTNPNMLNTGQKLELEQVSMLRHQQFSTHFEIKRLESELAAKRAVLASAENMQVPALELDIMLQSDPVARQLGMELAFRQMDAAYTQERVKEGVNNQHVARYLSEFDRLQQQYNRRVEELRVKAQEKKRTEIETAVLELETTLASFHEQYELLTKDILERVEKAKSFGETNVDIEMLQAELRQQELMAAELASERDKLKVELRSKPRISELGTVEKPLVASNTLMRIFFTVFVSLVSFAVPGLVITFFDVRAGRINSSDDVTHKLQLPVIGSVPRIPAQVIHHLASPSKRYRNWHLRLTESIDGIAARLLHESDQKLSHVIMVSSASGGEGKTTLATQLALSLARTGRRTVLVDFDLRRPSFDEVFGAPLSPGVSELLRGQNGVDEIINPSAAENLSVVTAGQWDRQALASLANGNAAPLFEELRKSFEFVVVDTSPILPVADARFVSLLADVVVLSVFRDVSQASKIQAAYDILAAFGVQSVEAVITGLNEHSYGKHMGYESTLNA